MLLSNNKIKKYIYIKKKEKFFALELGSIEFTSEAPALSRC